MKKLSTVNTWIMESQTLLSNISDMEHQRNLRNQLNASKPAACFSVGDLRIFCSLKEDQARVHGTDSEFDASLQRLAEEIEEFRLKMRHVDLDVEAVEYKSSNAEEDLSNLRSLVESIMKHLKDYASGLASLILDSLQEEYNVLSGKFRPGPVGEFPIHQCLILGLESLGKTIIKKYFNSPELISIPYTNDLDPWRQRKIDDDLKLVPWEDGLYTGETALHIAIVKQNVRLVKFLLDHGAYISSRATGTFFQPPWLRPLSDRLTLLQKVFAWMGNVDLERFRYATLTREKNPDSVCYYGELPLSFAASVGNVQICRVLYLEHQKRERGSCSEGDQKSLDHQISTRAADSGLDEKSSLPVDLWKDHQYYKNNITVKNLEDNIKVSLWRFVNAVDCFGNTAMHLAVRHSRKDVVDWLVQVKFGSDSLDVVNCAGFTPLTLAAREGNLDMFDHILMQHMRKVVWKYGDKKKSKIDLRQVKAFTIFCTNLVA
jgi:hypothetical protein